MTSEDIIIDAGLNRLEDNKLRKLVRGLDKEDLNKLKVTVEKYLRMNSNDFIDTQLKFGAARVKEVYS